MDNMQQTYYLNLLAEQGVTIIAVLIILMVFVYATFAAIRQTNKVTKALGDSINFVNNFEYDNSEDNAKSLVKHLKENDKHLFHSLARTLDNFIMCFRGNKNRVELIKDFYSQFEANTLTDRYISEQWFAFMRSFMVSIGVIGTFLGLVIGIQGASSGLASTDSAVARMGLEELLNGAGTAFYTSLAGILASSLFNFFYQGRLRKIENKSRQFTDLLLSLFPVYNPVFNNINMRNTLEEHLEQVKITNKALEHFVKDGGYWSLFNSMNKSISKINDSTEYANYLASIPYTREENAKKQKEKEAETETETEKNNTVSTSKG